MSNYKKNIKDYFLLFPTGFVLCFLQCYLSLKSHEHDLSAACLDCPFHIEVLGASLMTFLLLPLLLLLQLPKYNAIVKNTCVVIAYALVLFAVNLSIFESRVGAWSTFSHIGAMMGVWSSSWYNIVAATGLYAIVLHKISLWQPKI